MSAICGIVGFNDQIIEADDIARQLSATLLAEADRTESWVKGNTGLGHILKRMTPEDFFDRQPLVNTARDILLCADLRLDNRSELIKSLDVSANEAAMLPDSALLLRAYEKWGEDFVDHLLGEYAIVIRDLRSRRLLLVMDHLGHRSLYYYRGKDFIAFASDINALLCLPDVPHELNEEKLADFLLPGRKALHETIYRDIEALPGATIMTLDRQGAMKSRRYWSIDPDHEMKLGSDEEYAEAFNEIFEAAIAARLRTDHEVGLWLSGGFDSTAIAAVAAAQLKKRNRKLVCVASVLPKNFDGPERHARKRVEDAQRHIDNLEVIYDTMPERTIMTGLEETFVRTGIPASGAHYVFTALNETLHEQGVRVVMNGVGGDQSATWRGFGFLADVFFKGEFRTFFRELMADANRTNRKPWQVFKTEFLRCVMPDNLLEFYLRFFKPGGPLFLRHTTANAKFATRMGGAQRLRSQGKLIPMSFKPGIRANIIDVVENTMFSGGPVHSYTNGLGMQLTRPFFDKRVIEFGAAVPPTMHVRDGWNRYLIRTAMGERLPPELLVRNRRNHATAPDFHRRVTRIQDQILADLDRLETGSSASEYVDFDRIRQIMRTRPPHNGASGWEPETPLAVQGYLMSRFISWFEGDNR